MEQEQSDKSGLTKGSRKDLAFVRTASAGGWRSELPSPLVARIETAWAPLMRHLGYELMTQDASAVQDFPILSRSEGRTGPRDEFAVSLIGR